MEGDPLQPGGLLRLPYYKQGIHSMADEGMNLSREAYIGHNRPFLRAKSAVRKTNASLLP